MSNEKTYTDEEIRAFVDEVVRKVEERAAAGVSLEEQIRELKNGGDTELTPIEKPAVENYVYLINSAQADTV